MRISKEEAASHIKDAEELLKAQFDRSRSDKRCTEASTAAEAVSSAGIHIERAIAAVNDLAKPSATYLANMEACALSLSLCHFLFQEVRKITPHDTESDVAVMSFSNIGMRIAEAAETAALDAVEAMHKEASHD